MLKTKKQRMLAGVLAIGMLGCSGISARAFNISNLLNKDLKDNQVVKDVMSFYKSFGNDFAAGIQDYSIMSQQVIDQIRGVQGQFAPTEAKDETERKSDPKNLLDGNTKTGTAALATNELAGQQVLSKPAQEGIKKVNEEMKALDELAVKVSDDVYYAGQDAQGLTSSQEILKTISLQMSGQADIAVAQSRLAVIQNTAAQDLKMNAAALNVAAASQLEREMGKNQAEKIAQLNNQAAQANVVWRNMLLPTQ